MSRLWEELQTGPTEPDNLINFFTLFSFRKEELQAELPTPLCCLASSEVVLARSVEADQPPIWHIRDYDERVIEIFHCPFCGESLPELQKKQDPPQHIRKLGSDNSCTICLSPPYCGCSFPESAWEVVGGPQTFAAMGLIKHPSKNLFLGVSRKNNRKDFGLPGGKLDPGETPEQCVRREILEETGLTVKEAHLVYDAVDDHGHRCSTFRVQSFEGEINTQEAGAVEWLTIDCLTGPESSFRRFNKALFKRLGKHV